MSGSKSRRKGANFERRISRDLTAAGYDAKRNLEEVRSGNCGDIVFGDGTPLTIQCKCYEKRAPVNQAVREAKEVADRLHHYAIAVTKVNNADPVAHIPWHDLLAILGITDVRHALQRRV